MQPDSRGKLGAIAYASRRLNHLIHAEGNYAVTHLESLPIVCAIKKFRDLTYGYPVTVYTDHPPVTYLFKDKQLTCCLAKWALTLQEFGPEIKCVRGRANLVADALSRNRRSDC